MNEKYGTFYALSVGPGAPELMTVKACRCLERCPVIAAPQTKSGQMLALDIARGAVSLDGKEILPLRLPAGLDVAMVNLGDVSVYATAFYMFDQIQKDGFAACMLPGVTSFCAVAAQLDNFANQALIGHAHHVVHTAVAHSGGDYQRAGNLYYGSLLHYLHLPHFQMPRRAVISPRAAFASAPDAPH